MIEIDEKALSELRLSIDNSFEITRKAASRARDIVVSRLKRGVGPSGEKYRGENPDPFNETGQFLESFRFGTKTELGFRARKPRRPRGLKSEQAKAAVENTRVPTILVAPVGPRVLSAVKRSTQKRRRQRFTAIAFAESLYRIGDRTKRELYNSRRRASKARRFVRIGGRITDNNGLANVLSSNKKRKTISGSTIGFRRFPVVALSKGERSKIEAEMLRDLKVSVM